MPVPRLRIGHGVLYLPNIRFHHGRFSAGSTTSSATSFIGVANTP